MNYIPKIIIQKWHNFVSHGPNDLKGKATTNIIISAKNILMGIRAHIVISRTTGTHVTEHFCGTLKLCMI